MVISEKTFVYHKGKGSFSKVNGAVRKLMKKNKKLFRKNMATAKLLTTGELKTSRPWRDILNFLIKLLLPRNSNTLFQIVRKLLKDLCLTVRLNVFLSPQPEHNHHALRKQTLQITRPGKEETITRKVPNKSLFEGYDLSPGQNRNQLHCSQFPICLSKPFSHHCFSIRRESESKSLFWLKKSLDWDGW